MSFKRLTLKDWKQFQWIDIDFHPQMTILTGDNGSGKTTVLNLLAKHFGWSQQELATPKEISEDETAQVIRTAVEGDEPGDEPGERIYPYDAEIEIPRVTQWNPGKIRESNQKIGELYYSGNRKSELTIESNNAAEYSVNIENQRNVLGISIPATRQIYSYIPVLGVAKDARTSSEAYNRVNRNLNRHHLGRTRFQSNYHIKEALLNWKTILLGDFDPELQREIQNNLLDFQYILKGVLPSSIGFKRLSIRYNEVVFVTGSGDFMLDAVSGGMSAIIDLAWQIYYFATDNKYESATVIIDEVENHLHPNMQRSILPDFTATFPNVQFIVSTHSPLIVGSVKNSNVHAFRFEEFGEKSRVVSEKLNLKNKAKTAAEILNDVMKVPFTMPIWAEKALEEIVEKYSSQKISEDLFENMRAELEKIGLEDLMPEAIEQTLNTVDSGIEYSDEEDSIYESLYEGENSAFETLEDDELPAEASEQASDKEESAAKKAEEPSYEPSDNESY